MQEPADGEQYVAFEPSGKDKDVYEALEVEQPNRRQSFVEEFDDVVAGCGVRQKPQGSIFVCGTFLAMAIFGAVALTAHKVSQGDRLAHLDMGYGATDPAAEAQDLVRHSELVKATKALQVGPPGNSSTPGSNNNGRRTMRRDRTPQCLGAAIGTNMCFDMQTVAAADVEGMLQSLGAHQQVLSAVNSVVFPIMNALFRAAKVTPFFSGPLASRPKSDAADPTCRPSRGRPVWGPSLARPSWRAEKGPIQRCA